MEENNRMKEMPVKKLMLQMGVPMILSMALQAVYNIVDSAFMGNMSVGLSLIHIFHYQKQIPVLADNLQIYLVYKF